MMMRRVALQIGVPTLLAVIGWNAYVAANHLRMTQRMAALTVESSAIQANISEVLRDLTDMETGERGYLLAGDTAYLQPYTDAKAKVQKDFVALRAGLAKRGQHEQSLESQLESVAAAKQSEMERCISWRQRGYRHRAFKLVDTNEGKDYMDEIRRMTSSLSLAESSNFASLEQERNATFRTVLSASLRGNAGLFLLAACLFLVIRHQYRMLEKEAAQSRRELASRDLQLERLTSALSGQARSEIIAMNTTSRLLLENYGGFLPSQGHAYAEQMNEAAVQIERLRQDLVGSLASEGDGQAA